MEPKTKKLFDILALLIGWACVTWVVYKLIGLL